MPDIAGPAETGRIQPLTGHAARLALLALLSFSCALHSHDVQADDTWYRLPDPDQSDWSSKRLERYSQLDRSRLGEPLAIIRVPELAVAARIYPDVYNDALEAGAAWVSATSRPGEVGNIAIAGHRDSFFRPLEGIPLGTRISLTTAEMELKFAVTSVEIVDPLNTSPLAPTATTTLTLITCHPFRYQGFAPDRYIIRAELLEELQPHAERAESASRTTPAT